MNAADGQLTAVTTVSGKHWAAQHIMQEQPLGRLQAVFHCCVLGERKLTWSCASR